jgi:hypothetical protein
MVTYRSPMAAGPLQSGTRPTWQRSLSAFQAETHQPSFNAVDQPTHDAKMLEMLYLALKNTESRIQDAAASITHSFLV